MNPFVPDADMLRAYVYGELSGEQESRVRRWLIVNADAEVLAAYEALLFEREQRRALLAHHAGFPIRARLERLLWRATRDARTQLATLRIAANAERSAILAPLSSPSPASSSVEEVPPGMQIDLSVRTLASCHVTAFGITAKDTFLELLPDERLYAAGEEVPLDGFILEPGESFDVVVVLNTAGPIQQPAASLDSTAGLTLLQRVAQSATMFVLRRTFHARNDSDRGEPL